MLISVRKSSINIKVTFEKNIYLTIFNRISILIDRVNRKLSRMSLHNKIHVFLSHK